MFTIGFGKTVVFVAVVITQVGKLVAHTGVSNHAVSLFGHPFQVVHGTGGNMTDKEFFCGTSTQSGTHLVQHLFLRRDLAFFRKIPGCSQCTASRYDSDLNQWVGMFQEPGNSGMARFMQGNGTFLGCRHHFCLLLQTAHNTVDCSQKIILTDTLLLVKGSNQGSFVTYICNICSTESRSLASQQVYIYRVIQFQRSQMYAEHFLPFVQVRQVHVNLTVETSGTQ